MDLLKITVATVTGKRHKNYERTLAVRNTAYQMATGMGHEEEVKRYKPSEKRVLKNQRFALYNPLTKWVLSQPRKYWQKMAQVSGVAVTVTAENEARLVELESVKANFTTQSTLLDWVCTVLENKGVTDPNAWVVYDRRDERGIDGQIIRTRIAPAIYSSVDVLDYSVALWGVEYVVVRETRMEKVTGGMMRAYEKFFAFAPGMAVVLDEISHERPNGYYPEAADYTVASPEKEPRRFHLMEMENGTDEVPAAPVGAYLDDVTGLETYVPWFDPAMEVLRDLIKCKSLKDVYDVTCAFFRRYEYTKPCNHKHKEKGPCVGGWYNGVQDEAERCIACGGSGRLANHTTEQEILQLAMPKNSNDLLELSKLYHNEPIDTGFGEYLRTEIDRCAEMVLRAVLNSGIIERATGAATATETNYNYQDLYDLLHPFEKAVERHVELVIRLAGQYMEIEGTRCECRFPKDKKMKSVGQLLADLKAARDSGAPFEVVKGLQLEVVEKASGENTDAMARAKARLEWMPFADKSPEMAIVIVGGRSADDPDRLLYENFNRIFREIEAENTAPKFYEMTYEMQKAVVSAKVEEIAKQIKLIGTSGQTLETFPQGA